MWLLRTLIAMARQQAHGVNAGQMKQLGSLPSTKGAFTEVERRERFSSPMSGRGRARPPPPWCRRPTKATWNPARQPDRAGGHRRAGELDESFQQRLTATSSLLREESLFADAHASWSPVAKISIWP